MKNSVRLSLYLFAGCPWCERVKAAIEDLDLIVEFHDIRSEPLAAQQLTSATGSKTVPVLRIENAEVDQWLPESKAIVNYLYAQHGDGKKPAFFASTLPQRAGTLVAVLLLASVFFVPEGLRGWVSVFAVFSWLLGQRAPLIRKWF